MENKVSLWIGNLNDKEELKKIMQEIYNDEGDSSSEFMEGFEIDYIDNQFQEVFYYDNINTKEEIFDGFSYIESFFDKIPNNLDWNSFNCIILIYKFGYEGTVESFNGIDFIGVYDFAVDE